MTQDEIIHMARELATRHGIRMCDENGETHGEELYCVGVDDVAEIIKQAAAYEREKHGRTKDLSDDEIADALYGKGCWRLGVHPDHLREYRRVIQADREKNK